MIFIVDYFCKRGFLKIEKFKFVENPFEAFEAKKSLI